MDNQLYIQRLLDSNPLREPVLKAAVNDLNLPAGSHGLDLACGIGLQSLLLAAAVGPNGCVTGLDVNTGMLAYGQQLARLAGMSERMTFCRGDAARLPFASRSFDWVWSADYAGYPAGDWPACLAELSRVVRPGGKIALIAWSSQRVLPGYPSLEDWLNVNGSAYQPYLQAAAPEQHYLRGPYWFERCGLENVRATTYVRDLQAPLSPAERNGLISLFEMLWVGSPDLASDRNWAEMERLCRPESPDFILDQPGYYGFFTCTLLEGTLPA